MKKVKLILSIFMLALLTFGLASCGGFIAEESVVITDIKITPKEDGSGSNITIITLVDGEYEEEHKFFVANGEKGDTGLTGNGIAGISYAPSLDKKTTICTITFTDEEVEPKQIEIPNGSSIASVYTSPDDETGGTVVNFVLENGTELAPILIPKGNDGKDGVDGVGIKEIKPTIDPETGNTIVEITLTDEEETKSTITINKGTDGKGIDAIIGTETKDKYLLTIYYNTGDPETIEFNKPNPNEWHQGNTTPNPSLGRDGDYYFDITSKNIYAKYNGEWNLVVSFNSNDKRYRVSFDANGGSIKGFTSFNLPNGQSFYSYGYNVPTAERDGYEFLGWYTTKNPSPINGAFTDLTIVVSEMELFAQWEAKIYNISFDTMGGDELEDIKLAYETVLTDIVPTKSGYTFDGWYTSDTFAEEEQIFKVPAKDVTLYAKWISE